jgi:DNA-binding NarL/FixJ family response regulator
MSPVASRQVRLVGRDAELATAVAHVRAGGSVLFAGAAGVGKSRLADEVVRRLRPPKLVRIRATRASAGMPYGAFDHLLPRPPEEAVPGALGWVARAVAGPPGEVRLLLVDDAHALDPASAVVVHHLVTTGRTRVVMTLRCGVQPPDPMTALWKDEAVRRFDLSPFDESASAALLTAILRDAADPATERALYTMSGGNALLLRELVYAAKDTKALTGPPWRLDPAVPITTPRLLEVIEDRIGGLDAPLRTVLELLALAEPLTFDHLGALCGADIVEQCNTRELVTLADADGRWEVRLAHPLIGEAVRRRCGQVRAVRHFRDLARTAPAPLSHRDVLARATWQLEGGAADDPAVLLDAARTAWITHQHDRAGRFAAAAFGLRKNASAAILLATVHNYRQEPGDAHRVLDEVRENPASERERAELVLTRALAYASEPGRLADAVATLDGAEGFSAEWQQNLDLLRLNLSSRSESPQFVFERAGHGLADGPATPALRAQLLSSRAGSGLAILRSTTAVRSARNALAERRAWQDLVPVQVLSLHLNWGWAALLGGDMDEAERALASLESTVVTACWADLASAAGLLRAQLRRMRGDFGDALQAADLPGGAHQFVAARHATAAHVHAQRGDATTARKMLDRAEQQTVVRFGVAERSWLLWAGPATIAATGDLDGAVREALTLADTYRAGGFSSMDLLLSYDVVRFGAAKLVADRLTTLAEDAEGTLPALYALHARGVVDTDGPALTEVSGEFEKLGYLPYAAEAAAHAARAFAATGQARNCAAAQGRARRLADRCPGLRTPPLDGLGAERLTERELVVTRLAATGLTNKEIAARVHRAEKTVANQLLSAYAKLDVANRQQLRARLGLNEIGDKA